MAIQVPLCWTDLNYLLWNSNEPPSKDFVLAWRMEMQALRLDKLRLGKGLRELRERVIK
jgi:hypothetical protein